MQLTLLQMQEKATRCTEQISKLDWKLQLEELNGIVKEVGEWQKAVYSRFGQPTSNSDRLKAGKLYALNLQKVPIYKETGRMIDTSMYLPSGMLVQQQVPERSAVGYEPETIQVPYVSFHGATIFQGIAYSQETQTVHYKAILKTDENYFLNQMLPQSSQLPIHDPDYTLFDIQIKVPKAELIKESLHLLSEKLQEPAPLIKKGAHRLRRAKNWAIMDRSWEEHVHPLKLFGWLILGAIVAGLFFR